MSDDRRLPTRTQPRQDVQLHHGGQNVGSQILREALQNLTAEQRSAISAKAAEEAVSFELRRAQQAVDYVEGKKQLEDHIEAFDMLNKDGRTTRHTITSDFKTGAGKMTVQSKSGATCFVATAAYGHPDHPTVKWLRVYRDEKLTRTTSGRAFISFYWKVGPSLATVVVKSGRLRSMSRHLIELLVARLKTSNPTL